MAMVELEPMPAEEAAAASLYHHGNDLQSHGRVEVLEDMSRYDAERLHLLITRHQRLTGSKPRGRHPRRLGHATAPKFRKVMPVEYRRALAEMEKARTHAGGGITVRCAHGATCSVRSLSASSTSA